VVTPDVLKQIPSIIEPLIEASRHIRIEIRMGLKQRTYIVVNNERALTKLPLSKDLMSDRMTPIAENEMCLAQWFATWTDKRATVAFLHLKDLWHIAERKEREKWLSFVKVKDQV
jgi:hypothetical protein